MCQKVDDNNQNRENNKKMGDNGDDGDLWGLVGIYVESRDLSGDRYLT